MKGMYAGFAGAKTGHRGATFGRCRLLRIRCRGSLTAPAPLGRCHLGAVFSVRCKDPVEAGEVDPQFGHQSRQSGDEIERLDKIAWSNFEQSKADPKGEVQDAQSKMTCVVPSR